MKDRADCIKPSADLQRRPTETPARPSISLTDQRQLALPLRKALAGLQLFWNQPFSRARKDSREELSGALLRMAHLLLRAIRLHAVEGDKEDYASFQAEIQKLEVTLGDQPAPSEILIIAGSAVQEMHAYNRQITRFVRAQRIELQKMVAALTDSVVSIATGSERSISQLQSIGWRIQKASVVDDIRLINQHLSECLQSLQAETLRQKEEAARVITVLRNNLESRRELEIPDALPECGPAFDPVTGLGARTQAETALRTAFQERSHSFAVAFILNGLQSINVRSGRAMGDQAVKLFSQDLVKRLSAGKKVFRWSGTCIVSVMERSESIETIQAEMSRIVSRRLDLILETERNLNIIPLSRSATVIPIFGARSVETLIQRIDSLITSI